MNKSNLPKNWIVCSSKSYPDKVYYFNTVTNKTSWELPVAENQNEATSKENTKKRKLEKDLVQSRPVTPDMTQEKERPVIQAKRRISLVSQKTTNETPQMREIRARMLQKQATLNKGLKSASTKEDSSNKKFIDKKTLRKENVGDINDSKGSEMPEKVSSPVKQKRRFSEMPKIIPRKPERRLSTVNSNTEAKEKSVSLNSSQPAEETLTPQMRLMYEKLKERKAKKSVSSKKSATSATQSSSSNSSSSSSSSNSESSSASSSSSTTSDSTLSSNRSSLKKSEAEKPLNSPKNLESCKAITRRRSRLSTSSQTNSVAEAEVSNLPTLGEEVEIDDTKSVGKVSKKELNETLSTARKSGRTIFIPSKEQDLKFKIASKSPNANYPKNIAKQRLDDIRESLTLKNKLNESLTPERNVSLEVSQNYRPNVSSVTNMQTFIKEPGPEITLYTNAIHRAKNVRDKVLNYQSSNANVSKNHMDDLNVDEIENQSIFEKLKNHNNDPYYEEMEWEPIEDEKIMNEVQAVRSQLFTRSINHENLMQENVLELSNKKSDKVLYIVVDTNVFLSNLPVIEEARDTIFKTFGRPFIVVPWTVIQELDFIKDDKSATRSENLRIKARKAVRFLHQHFSTKHPRILGQTPQDVMKNKEIFQTVSPDDEILQSCLQIRESGRAVVLLSYDKNLCTKAMINDIVSLGRDDHFEKIEFMRIDNPCDTSFSASFHTDDNDNTRTALEEELLIAEDIFEKVKDQLRVFLSPIVVSEMRNLFGDGWERYTIIRPPWSTVDVLKCAIKHWMAAVSESFMRIADLILKELLDNINNPPAGGRRLKNVNYFLGRCSDLMQTLNQHKYPNLLNKTTAEMDVLRRRCLEETKRISEKRIRDEIGCEGNVARQNDRAQLALDYFNNVYSFTRDFCGVAAEAVEMPCTFLFEKTEKLSDANFVKHYQPILAANLNQLLQLLSLALEDLNGLRPDEKAINALTEALVTFLPDKFNKSNTEITSLDVYYLLKTKQDIMKRGLMQLQDLSQQFCRMASFRCK